MKMVAKVEDVLQKNSAIILRLVRRLEMNEMKQTREEINSSLKLLRTFSLKQ